MHEWQKRSGHKSRRMRDRSAEAMIINYVGNNLNDAEESNCSTVKLQSSGLGWLAAKGPLFWSSPLFLDLFMYYFLKWSQKKVR